MGSSSIVKYNKEGEPVKVLTGGGDELDHIESIYVDEKSLYISIYTDSRYITFADTTVNFKKRSISRYFGERNCDGIKRTVFWNS